MENTSVPMSLFSTDVTVFNIIRDIIGGARVDSFSKTVLVPEPLGTFGDENVPRAHLAFSLFLVLYADLLERVPHALKYFEQKHAEGETIFLDHGAVRTVDILRNGDLPVGEESLTRILIPLGYYHNETYPLTKLKMTGRSYVHSDYPDAIPQYFVSELHPDKFENDNFEKAVIDVVEESLDPLNQEILDDLSFIGDNGFLPRQRCTNLLQNIATAFNRQHPVPLLSDYNELLKHSAEMAWIATEGNAFNHATDRVPDVMVLAEEQKQLGNPMKDSVEVSKNQNIMQTAYKADPITRSFRLDDNEIIRKEVPGSFFEFITRKTKEDGSLDLAFDAGNATGIFHMTKSDEESPDDFDQ